ncbi:MAG: bifunctional [glutamate--ammonia ligase]-adenylyl-L-tyrosine phosphorylase/[glutamate--ammonia-ligase] adenylyltransferase [Pseudomonadota bacterium]
MVQRLFRKDVVGPWSMDALPVSPLSSTPIPAPLAERGERVVAALVARGELADDEAAAELRVQLRHLAACSEFASQALLSTPGLLSALLDGALNVARTAADYQALVDEAMRRAGTDLASAKSALRRLRRREMVRIAWRDLLHLEPCVHATLRELSAFADSVVGAAVAHSHAAWVSRHGEPLDQRGRAQRLVTVALGKLGGGELNFSSDIDVYFVFGEEGETRGVDARGRRRLDNGQFFTKVAQQAIDLLHSVTGEGFVFRVDTRLRPFGASGPLAMSLDGLEAYYQTQGRDWERYALVKARVLTGDSADRREVASLIRSFVYRRYLDYGVLASLRELKRAIATDAARRGRQHCLKRGVGGIREIEFIVQSIQLVRGGQDLRLQGQSLMSALAALADRGLISAQEHAFLAQAYGDLRVLENRLQMIADLQTHTLPEDTATRQRLVLALGRRDWSKLQADLATLRERVQTLFSRVLAMDSDDASPVDVHALWTPDADRGELVCSLAEHGFGAADAVASRLLALRAGAFYGRLSARSQARLDRLVPRLIHAVASVDRPTETLERALDVVRCIAGRGTYTQLLIDHPAALDLLLTLCQAGRGISDYIVRNPIVIDDVLADNTLREPIERDALLADLTERIAAVPVGDLEQRMDRLRQVRHSVTARVAIADVLGALTVGEVSTQLSLLAEVVLQVSTDCVWQALVARHGQPRCGDSDPRRSPGITVIAFGTLGGLELGYGSDLDLVFLHDSAGSNQRTDGPQPLDNARFYARFVQRLSHFLTALTPAGVLYQTDHRLRPDGRAGQLVSSFDAFDRYQHAKARTWEHQALIRARAVVGGEDDRARFERLRRAVLCRPRDSDTVRAEVLDMRARMVAELVRTAPGRVDLKQGEGGIADIEFMVQYAVLSAASETPSLVDTTDTVRLLDGLTACGVLTHRTATELSDAYLYFRETAHRLSLEGGSPLAMRTDTLDAHRARVSAIWEQLMMASDVHRG